MALQNIYLNVCINERIKNGKAQYNIYGGS